MNLRFGKRPASASMKICMNIIMLGEHVRHHIAGDGMNIIAKIAGHTLLNADAGSMTALVVGLIFAGRCGKWQVGER